MLSSMTRERRVALFLDFDGTLVEIAQGPDEIMVPEGLRDHLLQLDAALEVDWLWCRVARLPISNGTLDRCRLRARALTALSASSGTVG